MPHYLSLSIWVPILFGLATLAASRHAAMRWIALAGAVLGFLVTIPLFTQFDSSLHGVQFEELAPWIETYRINYHLGVDGISVLFILLNSFTTVLVVIAGWVVIEKKPAQYFAAFLIM